MEKFVWSTLAAGFVALGCALTLSPAAHQGGEIPNCNLLKDGMLLELCVVTGK